MSTNFMGRDVTWSGVRLGGGLGEQRRRHHGVQGVGPRARDDGMGGFVWEDWV